MDMIPHESAKGVYWLVGKEKNLATINLAEDFRSCGEELVSSKEIEYRIWSPWNSKLAAALTNGLSHLPFMDGSRVLYLGVASGTTASYVSDIVGEKGLVFGVDLSPRVIRDLLPVVRKRRNIIPILGDARRPEAYTPAIQTVESIYCDVAQRTQTELLVSNASLFLKDGGEILWAIKSRSIDSAASPADVFEGESDKLAQHGFTLLESVSLDPYQKDHLMIRATCL